MATDFAAAHPAIGGTRLVFGGNVFGWTIDQDRSFAVLDAFFEAGGRMIDTAEGYSSWVPSHKGGESETVIGQWLESRGVRSQMRIATKTGMGGVPGSLQPEKVAAALEGSLERLRTDYVDLYYAHRDDPETPLDEVAAGYDALFKAGRARELGASNYTPERLGAIIDTARRIGAQPFTVLQNEFNLIARDEYQGAMQDLCVSHGMAVLPFYALASGFLTGKFRDPAQWAGSPRAFALNKCATDAGWNLLSAMDEIVRETAASHAQIALAWLNSQPGIAAPLASATSVEQLRDLMGAASLQLDDGQIARLTAAIA